MKIIDINEQISDEDRQLAIVRQHAMHDSWWDSGNRKYQCINRNLVSVIKRDTLFNTIVALFGGGDKIGLGIGGRHTDTYYELNVDPRSHPCIWGDGRWLPFLDNSISFITNSHVLEHIDAPIQEIFKEWLRVIRPGGIIEITMPDKEFFAHDNSNPNHDWFNIAPNEMTAAEIKKELDKLEGVEILLFNTHQNRFDFDILIKKE